MKTPDQTLLAEAYEIADGTTKKIGTTTHVQALVAKLRAVEEKAHHTALNYLAADRQLTDLLKAAQRILPVASLLKTTGPYNLDPKCDLAAIENLIQALRQVKGK